MKLQLWIVDQKQFLFRQNYVQTILWILCKLRYFPSKITFAKKTKEEKRGQSQMQLTSISLFLSQWLQKGKKRWQNLCFSQKDMDKPYSFPRQKNYDFIKKTWFSKKLLLAELHKIPEGDQNLQIRRFQTPANKKTGQPVPVACTALDQDRHPQVLLCCNSFIQATKKRHQVHKVNSLFLTKTEASYSQ